MIEFGTGGWRSIIGDGFTKDNIQRVAAALAGRMKAERVAERGLCIGYDRRFLSREAAIWFSEAMAGEGVKVYFVNLAAPTPQIMFTVAHMGLPYGATITASHNPAVYNGIKLFISGGRDAPQDVTDPISQTANAIDSRDLHVLPFDRALAEGQVTFIDPRDDYLDAIIGRIDMQAIRRQRPRVVIDPMFGVSLTGLLTILYSARCDVNVINDWHDAFFGGHLPAPTPDTLRNLQSEVLERHAKLGIATDGDADRLGIVDENGRYVSSNDVLVLLYYYLLQYKGWHGPAVRNLATTHLLDRVAAAFGETCYEVPVGFKHISACMDAHDALIGGESSGGLTVRGHIHGKDGLYAASLLVEMICVTGRPLSALLEEVERKYGERHSAEYDWAVTPAQRAEIDRRMMREKCLPEFGQAISRVNYEDGCKVYFDNDDWVIARFSGTEPRIRVFAESGAAARADALAGTMAEFLGLPFQPRAQH